MTEKELVYDRILDAAPPEVFACLTEPEQLAAFWGPDGTSTPLDGIVVELRAGGRFETLMVSDRDGATHHLRAVFQQVQPPEVLSWTDLDTGMSTTITLRDTDTGRTAMHLVQRRVPDGFASPEARAGFATSLDRLERHLPTLNRKDV